MGKYLDDMKALWLSMLEPPWRQLRSGEERSELWSGWLIGWAWALAGMVFGALVAPSVVRFASLSGTSSQDWIVVAIAVVAGILIQLLGTLVFVPFGLLGDFLLNRLKRTPSWLFYPGLALFIVISLFGLLVPLAGVGYGIHLYLSWIGAGQREVTVAFVGALLIKTLAFPLIKGIVTGTLFRWFMKWLRGGKDTKKAA